MQKKLAVVLAALFVSSQAFAVAAYDPLLAAFTNTDIIDALVAAGVVLLGVSLAVKAVRVVLSMLGGAGGR